MPDRGARAISARLRHARATWRGLAAYRDDRLGFFTAIAREGVPTPCPLPGQAYLLGDANDVKHVLVDNADNYVKARRLTGPRATYPPPHTLLTSQGSDHRRRRLAMQRRFRVLADQLVERTQRNAAELVESWHGRSEVDLDGEMTALIQRSLLETLIASTSAEQLGRLAAATRLRTAAFDAHFVSAFPYPQLLPSRTNRDFLRGTIELRSGIEAEIAGRRDGGAWPDDLLSLLMRASFDDGQAMSDREVRDEAMSLLVTGHDSVSQALKWTLYLVARHPDIYARLAPESRRGANRVPHALARPYANSVIRESLRLFPPTWIFARVAGSEDRLPSGLAVASQAKLYISPYVLHREARWWCRPDQFIPERFADGARNGRPRHAYIPFGSGPHVCIGEAAAVRQIAAVLAAVTQRYRLGVDDPIPLPEAGLSLRPAGPMRVRLYERA